MEYLLKILAFTIIKFLQYLGITALTIFVIFTIYALPATFSLQRGLRPGLESKSIDEAVLELKESGYSDLELIEKARLMIGQRMAYNRRNSYDSYKKAFKRGYGFCQQQSFALAYILQELGFDAFPVQAMRTQFPDGNIGGHAWVKVNLNGETVYLDPIYYDTEGQKITFIPLSKVTGFTAFFRLLSGWGAASINAHRYYTSGTD
jgi:hypothetical protein